MQSRNRVVVPRHPDFSVSVEYIGNENQPVLLVDQFLNHADTLVEYAEQHSQFKPANTGYPGIRDSAPIAYLDSFYVHLADLIYDTFNLKPGEIVSAKADFSMVVPPPEKLLPQQQIPHFDSAKPNELAAVHYLCGPEKGGTSFYRHRSTGFESVDRERLPEYKRRLQPELQQISSRQSTYMNGSTEEFECIENISAEFNRLIVYRCTNLHSGDIAPDFAFDPNPASGRLTINTFLYSS